MQLRSNLYRALRRINYLPSDTKQGKETSYAYRVARVAGSPVTITLYLFGRMATWSGTRYIGLN